jgi:hypothetical protein
VARQGVLVLELAACVLLLQVRAAAMKPPGATTR